MRIPHRAASLNLSSVLEHTAMLTPQQPALTCGAAHVTYAQVDEAASRLAAGLHALGIGTGDHVALSCPNVPDFAIAYYGILKAGAVVVPLNVLLKPREIAYHLRDGDTKAVIAHEGTPELPIASMARAACDETGCDTFIVSTIDRNAVSPIAGSRTLAQIVQTSQRAETIARRPDDTAVILYTSGTTGYPKGAELTHQNLLLNAITSFEMYRPVLQTLQEQPVALVTLPLFHSTAQTCLLNAGMYGGYRLVLLPRFEPAAVLDTMQRERVAVWIGVPTMYWLLLQHAAAGGVDPASIATHLRLCVSGGAPMPHDVMRRFEETFGVRILEGYGLSETSPVVSFNQLQRPSKPGTVGLPVFGVDIRCVDEHGKPVPPGERGEVVVRGPNVMKGYYKREDATADATRNGWFHTGDIGTLDTDGYLTIVDRKTDMIIRGGLNVYPREIEEVFMTHPAVSLAAVIGVPDPRLGEEVKAYVVLKPGRGATAQELIDWAREQMAAYKYPRFVEIRDALPIGPTGKVLKRALRQ
jgi:long-chain acyl-CoA synthetase